MSRELNQAGRRTSPTSVLGGRVWLALTLGLLLGLRGLSAQTIEGVLLERGSDAPIELGLVTLFTLDGDSVASALSDPNGRFRVASNHAGAFLLAASALGYRSTVASSVFELAEGSSISVEFRVEPVAIEIGGLLVETDSRWISQPSLVRNGFVERARQGFGRFITPTQIEETTSLSTTDLLTRTGRIMTQYAAGGDRVLMRGFLGYCTPFVYLDGIRISISEVSLDAIAPLSVLEAVEVYRTAEEAPPQYAVGLTRCGVIVLWTKTR